MFHWSKSHCMGYNLKDKRKVIATDKCRSIKDSSLANEGLPLQGREHAIYGHRRATWRRCCSRLATRGRWASSQPWGLYRQILMIDACLLRMRHSSLARRVGPFSQTSISHHHILLGLGRRTPQVLLSLQDKELQKCSVDIDSTSKPCTVLSWVLWGTLERHKRYLTIGLHYRSC